MFIDDEQEVAPEIATEEVAEVETDEVETEVDEGTEEPEAEITVDWEAEAKKLQAELGRTKREFKKEVKKTTVSPGALAVEDYIDISTSLDGLDPREKARLAEEHKLSGKPLKQIRESEDYQLWQSAYRAKMEKENALRPSSTQSTENVPKSAGQKIAGAQTLAEKEAVLRELGLYKDSRPRADKVTIGLPHSF